MVDRRTFIGALASGFLVAPLAAHAQQAGASRVPRIGVLSSNLPAGRSEAFLQGLRELGYLEGKSITIEWRNVQGRADLLPAAAAELVGLNVDLIVASDARAAVAANQAASKTPIVVAAAGDLVGSGLVSSLARPGGKVTGLTLVSPDLLRKGLELLKELNPKLSRVVVLGDSQSQSYAAQVREMEVAAMALGLQLQLVELRGPNDFENAALAIAKGGGGAVTTLRSPFINSQNERVVQLAMKSRLPAIDSDSQFVDAGGLMSYGPNYDHLFHRAATYVDKILRGARPSDLPVEQPTRFELVINLKTAKTLGITIPQALLLRANEVIQ